MLTAKGEEEDRIVGLVISEPSVLKVFHHAQRKLREQERVISLRHGP
jgi:hypothetical protein